MEVGYPGISEEKWRILREGNTASLAEDMEDSDSFSGKNDDFIMKNMEEKSTKTLVLKNSQWFGGTLPPAGWE